MNKTNIITQNASKLLVDLIIFVGFLLAMDPRSTGITIHEWFTIAGVAVLIIHLLLNWSWIVQITTRFFKNMPGRTRLNYVLNVLLFIDMTIIMFTGIIISQSFLPFLGISVQGNFLWRGLHNTTSNLFIVILGSHLALHWSWIVRTTRHYIAQPIVHLFSGKRGEVKKQEVQA
jgi:hypothetical protein